MEFESFQNDIHSDLITEHKTVRYQEHSYWEEEEKKQIAFEDYNRRENRELRKVARHIRTLQVLPFQVPMGIGMLSGRHGLRVTRGRPKVPIHRESITPLWAKNKKY